MVFKPKPGDACLLPRLGKEHAVLRHWKIVDLESRRGKCAKGRDLKADFRDTPLRHEFLFKDLFISQKWGSGSWFEKDPFNFLIKSKCRVKMDSNFSSELYQAPRSWNLKPSENILRTVERVLKGGKGYKGYKGMIKETLHSRDLMMFWDLCGTWPLSQLMLKLRWWSLYYTNGSRENACPMKTRLKIIFQYTWKPCILHTSWFMTRIQLQLHCLSAPLHYLASQDTVPN